MEYPEGGENRFTHKLRGRLKYPNIVSNAASRMRKGSSNGSGIEGLGSTWASHDSPARAGFKSRENVGVRRRLPGQVAGAEPQRELQQVATETLEIVHGGLLDAGRELIAMPMPEGYVKAKLAIEGGDTIQCCSTRRSTRSRRATTGPSTRSGAPRSRRGSSAAASRARCRSTCCSTIAAERRQVGQGHHRLALQDDGGRQRVRLERKNSGRPPTVTFQWGEMSRSRRCASLTQHLVSLFKPNGTPIRAQVKLALTQVAEAVDQRGVEAARSRTRRRGPRPGSASHVVRDGDSLHRSPTGRYGDPTLWRLIAEANGIDDPLRLPRGSRCQSRGSG